MLGRTTYYTAFLLMFCIHLIASDLYSQITLPTDTTAHELIVYVVHEPGKIQWKNPAKLLKSSLKSCLKASIRKDPYRIGHTVIQLKSPILDSAKYFGVYCKDLHEQKRLIIKEKVGLGILGYSLLGELESSARIKTNIDFYQKKNELRFIRFYINAEAVLRIMEFVEYYTATNEYGFAPSEIYNGALDPLYRNEGSGCTSFVIATMDLINILPEQAREQWLVDVNIPMELIGGELNNNKKVRLNKIIKSKKWYSGEGVEGQDYAKLKIFSPSKMYHWINEKHVQNDSLYIADMEGNSIGIKMDARHIQFDNEDMLRVRNDTTFLIKHYYSRQVVPQEE